VGCAIVGGVPRTVLVASLLAAACGGGPGPHPRPHASAATAAHRAPSPPPAATLGRSPGGRRIVVLRAGDPRGPKVLVVGCIHGNETAGIPVARALSHARTRADLWIVPDLNPDGVAAGTRQNGRGVDLNANWASQWRGGGRPWDVYYPGPRPFSEPETRLARRLILRIRPRVAIWFHQHMDVVWAWGPSSAAGRLYARVAGMRLYHHHWLPGTAANWQNHVLPHTSSFTVELPAGRLDPVQLRRQVRAVLRVAAGLGQRRARADGA
jgi:protein MpaA